MRIPEHVIDDIRNSVNIVDVIGSVVRLKKAGQNFIGLCPFHQEKTASFSVSPSKQIYKCFGCGEGGNVFSFLMKDQNMTFADALKQLAEKSGIDLSKYKDTPQDQEKKQQNEELYAVNEFAAEWFVNNLRNTKEGKKALDYLLSRGFKEETLELFGTGYAPDSWDGLINAAHKAKYKAETLALAGLVVSKASSSYYDRFRDRIIFPIKNEYGRAVGFGGRAMKDQEGAKYINTPETPVYHKGRVLYGLFQNKDFIRKKDMVILVEGYTDVMALNEYGVGVGVASLGTSLTQRQAQLIKRYTKNAILLYDADAAGVRAALRGSEILFGADIDISVVNLGDNSDPDSYLRDNSRDAFLDEIRNRKSIVEFYASSFDKDEKELSANEKVGRIRDMIDLVDNIQDQLKRELMLKEIGENLSTDVKSIFKEYYRKKRTQSRYKKESKEPETESKEIELKDIDPVERRLAQVLVNEPGLAKQILKDITELEIRDNRVLSVVDIVKEVIKSKKKYTPADIIAAEDNENFQKFVSSLGFEYQTFSDISEDEHELSKNDASSILSTLKARKVDRELSGIQDEIKNAEKAGKSTAKFIKKYNELFQKRSKLAHPSKK
ncbi:MAG: DNA primase [bacterium]|nr:DNA primase [bacterium]